jgi:hypothetical protein
VICLIQSLRITINMVKKPNTLVTWTIINYNALHLLLMKLQWFFQQELELEEILLIIQAVQELQKNKEIKLKH